MGREETILSGRRGTLVGPETGFAAATWDARPCPFRGQKRKYTVRGAYVWQMRSTRRHSSGAESRGIGFNLRGIAVTELGLEPCGNREIRTGYQKLFGSSPGFLGSAGLLIGNHDIGKAKSGITGVIRLKGLNRLFGSSR